MKNKNIKTLKIAIILFVIAITLVFFVVLKQNTNLFGSKQIAEMQGVEEEYFEEDNIKEENIQENNSEETLTNEGISTYATKASEGYKIYGEQPFTEEYSVGAFVPQDQVIEYKCGPGFEHIGTGASGTMLNRTQYIASNTSKQSDIY